MASCEVICGTTPMYYSSTTLYSVPQNTTPVLLCTTKYYSSTTLYYKVLCQYYSSTTKYYASTTKYYNVLLQYYSVLQSITPVLPSTTKYYASTTLYYKVLQRTTPVSSIICVTYKTSFPMRGASQVTLQPHQILRLPRNLEGQHLRGNP